MILCARNYYTNSWLSAVGFKDPVIWWNVLWTTKKKIDLGPIIFLSGRFPKTNWFQYYSHISIAQFKADGNKKTNTIKCKSVFGTHSNIYVGVSLLKCFSKKVPSKMFDRVLNTPLTWRHVKCKDYPSKDKTAYSVHACLEYSFYQVLVFWLTNWVILHAGTNMSKVRPEQTQLWSFSLNKAPFISI